MYCIQNFRSFRFIFLFLYIAILVRFTSKDQQRHQHQHQRNLERGKATRRMCCRFCSTFLTNIREKFKRLSYERVWRFEIVCFTAFGHRRIWRTLIEHIFAGSRTLSTILCMQCWWQCLNCVCECVCVCLCICRELTSYINNSIRFGC